MREPNTGRTWTVTAPTMPDRTLSRCIGIQIKRPVCTIEVRGPAVIMRPVLTNAPAKE